MGPSNDGTQQQTAYDISQQRAHNSLLVIGDSLCFYGPKGALPPSNEGIWPVKAAQELGLKLELFAQAGWTTRHAWWELTRDPRVWEAIASAQTIVIAVGTMDSMQSPLPTALRENIRHIRPAKLRRWVRKLYVKLQPKIAPHTPFTALPHHLTVDYLERIRTALTTVRPDVTLVVALPAQTYAETYGYAHPGRSGTSATIATWAAKHDIPTVDLYQFTKHDVEGALGNPDGMHWGFDVHTKVAHAVATIVRQQG